MTHYVETVARETTGIFVACRENGDLFEKCATIEEALAVIASYEEEDKLDGIYTEDYYEIADEEHNTIYYWEVDSVKTLFYVSTFSHLTAFADYFGIAYRTVQNWVNGYRKCPSYILDLLIYKLVKEGKIAEPEFSKSIAQ